MELDPGQALRNDHEGDDAGLLVTHAQRGQALAETVIALPLFLLAMFAMIWAVQASVLAERVQLGVRYAGVIGSKSQPYLDYSLYTVYGNLNGTSKVATQPCFQPTGDVLMGRGPYLDPAGKRDRAVLAAGDRNHAQDLQRSDQPELGRYHRREPEQDGVAAARLIVTLHGSQRTELPLRRARLDDEALRIAELLPQRGSGRHDPLLRCRERCRQCLTDARERYHVGANSAAPLPAIPDQTVLAPVAACAK